MFVAVKDLFGNNNKPKAKVILVSYQLTLVLYNCHLRSWQQGGSHSYTNPTCIPEGTYTGGTGTQQGSSGTGTQQGSGGTGSGSVTHRPPATHAPVIDPNQPIEELPGK